MVISCANFHRLWLCNVHDDNDNGDDDGDDDDDDDDKRQHFIIIITCVYSTSYFVIGELFM